MNLHIFRTESSRDVPVQGIPMSKYIYLVSKVSLITEYACERGVSAAWGNIDTECSTELRKKQVMGFT